MRLSDAANSHRIVTVELIPNRVIPAHLPILQGRVDAITIPALRNGENDLSYQQDSELRLRQGVSLQQ